MRLLSRVVPIAAFTAAFGLTAAALAAQIPAPADCATGRNLTMFNGGVLKGRSLVQQAWNSPSVAKSCQNSQRLQDAVVKAFAAVVVPPAASKAVACQFLGQHDGALDELGIIQNGCPFDQCILDGQFVGQMAAVLYCDLSISLQGLGMDVDLSEPPIDACGQKFEAACREVFASMSQNFEQTEAGQNCDLYTLPPFLEEYNQAQHNQCLYDPQPPDGAFCGDGVINQTSEECEPPNTATCDANCKKIPVGPVCGDGVVTPPEECEPPNTTTCNASCKKIPQADGCAQCENSHCDEFFGASGAWGCDTLTDAADKAACQAYLICVRTTHCAAATQDTQACYCGTAADLACLTGSANGQCKAQAEAAAKSTDPGVIAGLFTDPTFPIGRVSNQITCDVNECVSACPL